MVLSHRVFKARLAGAILLFLGVLPPLAIAQPLLRLDVDATDVTSVRLQWVPIDGASEYTVTRDGEDVGSTIAKVGYFSDFGLEARTRYRYLVTARDSSGNIIARSREVSAKTRNFTTVRTRFTVLAIAFDPDRTDLITEKVYLKHRIQFLDLASLGAARIQIYKGNVVSIPAYPPLEPGGRPDYRRLVTTRDLPGLNGNSIVDLVERGDIDHVWVIKSPVEFAENILIGSHPIQGDMGTTTINTWVPLPVKVSRSFFVNAYTPDERSYDAYSHMVEGVMTSISDGHPDLWPHRFHYTAFTTDRSSYATIPADLNEWERFRLADGWNGPNPVAYASSGNANIGSSHFPPTTPRQCADYCYYDAGTWRRYVASTADAWRHYPNLSDRKRQINGYEFGAFNVYFEGTPSYGDALLIIPENHDSFRFSSASYHQWWFAHLPHNPGITGGKLNSWWPYLFDFNRFNGSRIDYKVRGFPSIPDHFPLRGREYGTEANTASDWGYWNSQNGFSPGAKAASLKIVKKGMTPDEVDSGARSLEVTVENTQFLEYLGFGRNDLFYPRSRNAGWRVPRLNAVEFSVKLLGRPELFVGTNPIVRLYKNGGTRIELVPKEGGAYANLFADSGSQAPDGWYHFRIPLRNTARWEKNVIGYVNPSLTEARTRAARAALERDILNHLDYVEVSIRTTNTPGSPPYDTVSYVIDGLRLIDGGRSR